MLREVDGGPRSGLFPPHFVRRESGTRRRQPKAGLRLQVPGCARDLPPRPSTMLREELGDASLRLAYACSFRLPPKTATWATPELRKELGDVGRWPPYACRSRAEPATRHLGLPRCCVRWTEGREAGSSRLTSCGGKAEPRRRPGTSLRSLAPQFPGCARKLSAGEPLRHQLNVATPRTVMEWVLRWSFERSSKLRA